MGAYLIKSEILGHIALQVLKGLAVLWLLLNVNSYEHKLGQEWSAS